MSRRQTPDERAAAHRARLDAAHSSRARLAAAMDWFRAELAAASDETADAYADAATHRLRELADQLSTQSPRRRGAA